MLEVRDIAIKLQIILNNNIKQQYYLFCMLSVAVYYLKACIRQVTLEHFVTNVRKYNAMNYYVNPTTTVLYISLKVTRKDLLGCIAS